jgi:hypothetical protein
MANLVEVAEELEYVPKDQLVQMAKDPNSRFPSYMVLSEIQRRTQMERMYNAQRAERPTSTVAEELVGEFANPQGLAGMSADRLGPQPNDFSRSAMPASSPMQMAAGGGRTGYADKGKTEPLYREPMAFGGDKEYDIMTSLIRDPASNQLISQKEYNQLYPPAPPAEKSFFETIADKASKAINRPSKIEQIKNAGLEALVGGHIDAMEKGEQASMKFIADNMGIMNRATLREMVRSHKNKFPEKKGLGGRVGYQNLGATGDSRVQLLNSLGIDTTNLTEKEIQQALLFATNRTAALQPPEQDPLPEIDIDVDRPVDNQPVRVGDILSDRGVDYTAYSGDAQDASGSGIGNFFENRYYDEEGDFNLGTALLDASMFIPGVGLLGAGIRGGLAGLRGLRAAVQSGEAARKTKKAGESVVKAAKATVTKPKKVNPKDTTPEILGGKKGPSAAQELGYVTPKGVVKPGSSKFGNINPGRQFSASRSALTGTGLLAAQTLNEMNNQEFLDTLRDTPVVTTPDQNVRELTEKEKADLELQNRLAAIFGGAKEGEATEKRKGLFGKINAYIDQADGLDVAKLGGIIMGARNMSELGAGIASLAGDVQTRRDAKETRDRAAKLEEIKGAYYQAQTEETLADIEAMPATQLNALLERYGAFQKQINEGLYTPSEEELEAFNRQYRALLEKASRLQGIETISKADEMRAILEEARI